MKRVLVDFSEEEWQVIVVRRKTKCWRSLSKVNTNRKVQFSVPSQRKKKLFDGRQTDTAIHSD